MQALVQALEETASGSREESNIVLQISAVRNPHITNVTALENRLHDDTLKTNGLFQSFGALASNAKSEVEREVSQFLLELRKEVTPTDEVFTTVILAMGNTSSEYVMDSIINCINHPLEHIQLACLRACLKFTHLPQVRTKLNMVLQADISEAVTMIVHTLVKGYQYFPERDLDTSVIANHSILRSLVLAVHNTNLQMLLSDYLQKVRGE